MATNMTRDDALAELRKQGVSKESANSLLDQARTLAPARSARTNFLEIGSDSEGSKFSIFRW